MEIVLGTANFGNAGYGTTPNGLSPSDVISILSAARGRVSMLDTADGYGMSLHRCRKYGEDFKIMHKSRDISSMWPGEIPIFHNFSSADQAIVDWDKWQGASIYDPSVLDLIPRGVGKIVSVPMNMMDLRFLPKIIEKPDSFRYYIRSVFLRGNLPYELGVHMLRIAKRLPITGAIIGADFYYQFLETLNHIKNEFTVDYANGTWKES